jgi:3',5'-cyclic AMP phosphodiesterase CpdA
MVSTVTLAHLSDVHLAPLEGFTMPYWNLKRALGYLNWQRGRVRVHQRGVADKIAADVRAQAPDHIAVSGDLANLGLPAEYSAARLWLEALGSSDCVSVVPGNHDIYTGRMHGASCLADWAPYMTSDAWGTEKSGLKSGFPYVRRIGPIALIGVNSAVPTPPFVAAGRLGDDQIAALAGVLDRVREQGLARVVMIHHPPLPDQAPKRRALEDASALKAVLEQHGAELVLHGHNHTETIAWLPSAHGDIPICGIASASAGIAHHGEPLARYALYQFEQSINGSKTLTLHRVTRGLAEAGGEVVELSRSVLKAVA